jgi:hypothetical protein
MQQWTDGSKPLRSKRVINPSSSTTTSIQELPSQNTPPIVVTANDFSLPNTSPTQFIGEEYPDTSSGGPRETMYFKMAERDMLSQTGRNPFFFNSTSYVDHVSVQDKFLKPKSTIMFDKSVANE